MNPLKKKAFASLILIFLLLGGALFLNFQILLPRAKQGANEIVNLRKEILLIEEGANNYEAQRKQSVLIDEARTIIAQSFPTLAYSSARDFFYFLEKVAKETENSIEIDIREEPPISFPVILVGSFPKLIAFLVRLEKMPIKINVIRIAATMIEGLPVPFTSAQLTTTLEITPLLPSLAPPPK